MLLTQNLDIIENVGLGTYCSVSFEFPFIHLKILSTKCSPPESRATLGRWDQGLSWLHDEFEANRDYVRPSFKNVKKVEKKKVFLVYYARQTFKIATVECSPWRETSYPVFLQPASETAKECQL